MWSPSGRYVIVFNGEIYNFKTLRSDLAQRGYAFKGNSDTEVMLASIEAFGVEQSLHKFNGMFAFALWDTHARTLYLARDRLGEKPLYYGWCSGVFLFGSELKALAQHPAWSGDIDPEAVASYLRFNYVPGPRSIYRRIAKLPPGSFLSIPCGKSVVDSVPYWNLGDLILASRRAPWTGSEEEAVEALECHLKDAVRERMISDVPLGAFLSGGVDSSTVVAMMQAVSASQINT
jgi:asparagine synthase (glutamine-hydrolysing)